MKSFSIPTPVLMSLASAGLGFIMLVLFLMFYAPSTTKTRQPTTKQPARVIQLQDGALSAKAAIIYDPTTGKILYDKNGQLTLPLASITKLMTAQVVLGAASTSKLVTLTRKDVSIGSDAGDWGLRIGDVLSLGDLLKLGLVASSNYAMSAAAGALGEQYVADMNTEATGLGLSHTYFLNPTGLDVTVETSGAYGSAYDIARLAAAFLKEYPQYFELSSEPSVTVQASGRPVTVNATAIPLHDIPGFIGAKTGYTDLAGGNLVMAYDIDINHPLIAVVLGSSKEGRFTDMRTLVTASRQLYSSSPL